MFAGYALYQIYNVAAGTVVVEYHMYFFDLLIFKTSFFCICLQQSDLKFVRYGEHLPGFSFCNCLFLTLFFSILLLPINSVRFLFCLNAVIDWQSNISFRDSFIFRKFECFHITLLMLVQKRL